MREKRCMWERMSIGVGGGEEQRRGDDKELNRVRVYSVGKMAISIGKREPVVGC
jgi:hypothetical protein